MWPFKKTTTAAGELGEFVEAPDKTGPNPWLEGARREWDDRVMNIAKDRHSWKMGFFIALGVIAIQGMGLAVLGSQSKIEPHLAVVDKTTYQVHVVGSAESVKVNDKMMKGIVERHIREYITALRVVIGDRVAQKKLMESVYVTTSGNSPAARFVSAWFTERNPLKLAEDKSVSVDVENPLPLSDKTYQVEWTETELALNGEVMGRTRWKAVLTYTITPPTDDKEFNKNPVGWYVNRLEWSRSPG